MKMPTWWTRNGFSWRAPILILLLPLPIYYAASIGQWMMSTFLALFWAWFLSKTMRLYCSAWRRSRHPPEIPEWNRYASEEIRAGRYLVRPDIAEALTDTRPEEET